MIQRERNRKVKNEMVFPHFDWIFSFRLFKNMGSGLEVLWADPDCLLLWRCWKYYPSRKYRPSVGESGLFRRGKIGWRKEAGEKILELDDSIALLEIDCKNKKHRVLALIVYSMGGKAVISDIRERERGFIVPESIFENLYKTVCKQGTGIYEKKT